MSEGVQLLRTFRSAQERWRLDHGAYTADCTDLDVAVNPANFGQPTCFANGSVSVTRTGGAYTITATALEVYSLDIVNPYLQRYLPQ
jgi:hypothetical protein